MRKLDESIIGQRFGKLIVLGFEDVAIGRETRLICKCDCGTLTSVRRSSLLSGHTASCGCLVKERRPKDIIGKRFGYLTVIDHDHSDTHGRSYWLCRCDCGEFTVKRRDVLLHNNTISCGCKRYVRDDLTGRRFTRLTVISLDHIASNGDTCWLCECDCGNSTVVRRNCLVNGGTKSCGCYAREKSTRHGQYGNRLYNIWSTMIQRCTNPSNKSYQHYGGRGIFVCDEWREFEEFYEWSIVSGYDDDLTIDRIDTDDGYYPENCRWADQCTQQNNRRNNNLITYSNVTHTVAEWARILGVNYKILWKRINRGDMRDFEDYYSLNERIEE